MDSGVFSGHRSSRYSMGDNHGKGAHMVRKLTIIMEARLTLALSIVVLAASLYIQLSDPVPYKDVELLSYEYTGEEIRIVATFEKTDCIFNSMQVVGGASGQTEFLDWRDLDGMNGTEDRSEGIQTMRIAFELRRDGYDWVEVRTRHNCDGEKVDKVFIRFDEVP